MSASVAQRPKERDREPSIENHLEQVILNISGSQPFTIRVPLNRRETTHAPLSKMLLVGGSLRNFQTTLF